MDTPPTMKWIHLPDTDTRVLLDERDTPRMLRVVPSGNIDHVKAELEQVTAWRVMTKTLTNWDSPKGGWLAVEWAGKLGTLLDHATLKTAPIGDYWKEPDGMNAYELCGMPAVSITHQLKEPWRGFERGDYLIWASHPGCLGVARRVGVEGTLFKLAALHLEGAGC